jgi:signal peptidase I
MADLVMNINFEIVLTVLESGNSVELTASGYSMFPTLRRGDKIVVKPLRKEELPIPGNVVVFLENGSTAQQHNSITDEQHNDKLVLHRLVEIKVDDSGNPLLIARGDSAMKPDNPWTLQQLIGKAVSYKRDKKEYPIKTFIPGILRYLFNYNLVWMINKLMRLMHRLGKLVSIR